MEQDERLRIGIDWAAAMRTKDWVKATDLARQQTPLYDQLAITIVGKQDNNLIMTMELSESVRGLADGSIHGGMLATFADVASAFSLIDLLDDDSQILTTTDMHIRYYRQPRSGPLRAEAKVVHRGRRLLSVECSIADADDRVLTRATATYMLVPRSERAL